MLRVRALFFAGVAMGAGVAAWGQNTTIGEWTLPSIRVVDEAGKPVTQADVAMQMQDKPMMTMGFQHPDAQGEVKFNSEDMLFGKKAPEGKWDVLVLAQGKAPIVAAWDLPTSDPLTVKVSTGKPVEITLKTSDSTPLSEAIVPRFYPQRFALAAWPNKKVSALNATGSSASLETSQSQWPKALGKGRFEISLNETTERHWKSR